MTYLKAIFPAIVIVALSAFGQSASAQAFGIAPGTPLEDLVDLEPFVGDHVGVYNLTVPNPHPEFRSYSVKAHPETGVCIVSGNGKDHENDRYGLSVQKSFLALETSLAQKYGESKTYDYLREGALWGGADEWVMSVYMNERVRHVSWRANFGADLPNGMLEIHMAVFATSPTTSSLGLTYRFSNVDRCNALIADQQGNGL